MKAELQEHFPIDIAAQGTVMDYVDDEFVFIIKDELWTPYEINAVKQAKLQVDFVYKYDIAIFLLTLVDAIDTSDFIFNVHDNTYDASLFDAQGYSCTLYLLDKENIVQAKRSFQMGKDMSKLIADKLKQQAQAPYLEEEFTCNLEGLQSAMEPFEMQEIALTSGTF